MTFESEWGISLDRAATGLDADLEVNAYSARI